MDQLTLLRARAGKVWDLLRARARVAGRRARWWWSKNWDAVLDVAGLIAVPTGVWILAGPGWALIAVGPALIVTSWHLHRRPR